MNTIAWCKGFQQPLTNQIGDFHSAALEEAVITLWLHRGLYTQNIKMPT